MESISTASTGLELCVVTHFKIEHPFIMRLDKAKNFIAINKDKWEKHSINPEHFEIKPCKVKDSFLSGLFKEALPELYL